jgi:hypothetical protein
MNEQTDPRLKSDAAIQVKVCGQDVHGQRFDEIGTAFPTSNGVMLETIHQLREGVALELIETVTNRKAIVNVKSLGPNLGVSSLVFLEGLDLEGLWINGFSQEPIGNGPAGDAVPLAATEPRTDLAAPPRALMQISKPLIPKLDRLMTTLGELVESALESNLRPAMEQLTSEIPEHVLKARNSVFANLEEQIQACVGTFGERLNHRAAEVAERSENVITQKARELDEGSLLLASSRQDEFRQHLEQSLSDANERLNQQVESLNLAERLSEKMNIMLDSFSAEVEQRWQQASTMAISNMHTRLEEVANAFAERARQVEAELTATFSLQRDEVERRVAELRQVEDDVRQKQQKLAWQTESLLKDWEDQNRNRVAWVLKELGERMVKIGEQGF